MLFDPEVGMSIKGGNVVGRQGGGREINECYSETKKNWSWEMLPETKEGSLHPSQ
jgi:hypothetical protein